MSKVHSHMLRNKALLTPVSSLKRTLRTTPIKITPHLGWPTRPILRHSQPLSPTTTLRSGIWAISSNVPSNSLSTTAKLMTRLVIIRYSSKSLRIGMLRRRRAAMFRTLTSSSARTTTLWTKAPSRSLRPLKSSVGKIMVATPSIQPRHPFLGLKQRRLGLLMKVASSLSKLEVKWPWWLLRTILTHAN